MHDGELLKEIFWQILGACDRIINKTSNISDPEYLYTS